MRRSTCLYCEGPLIPYGHWGICPMCEPSFLESIKAPDLAKLMQAKVGGLLTEKGRPTINGVKR